MLCTSRAAPKRVPLHEPSALTATPAVTTMEAAVPATALLNSIATVASPLMPFRPAATSPSTGSAMKYAALSDV